MNDDASMPHTPSSGLSSQLAQWSIVVFNQSIGTLVFCLSCSRPLLLCRQAPKQMKHAARSPSSIRSLFIILIFIHFSPLFSWSFCCSFSTVFFVVFFIDSSSDGLTDDLAQQTACYDAFF